MFINPPRAVERYFDEERADGRQLTAHMLATGFVVLNTSSVIDALIQQAKTVLSQPPNYSAFHTTMTRYGAATLFEDATDVAERDPATAAMLLDKAVLAAMNSFFVARNLALPRKEEIIGTMSVLDAVAGRVTRAYYTSPAWPDRLAAATMLFDRVIGTRGFFEWDSEAELSA